MRALIVGAGLSLALVAAACGGDDSSSGSTGAGSSSPVATSPAATSAAGSSPAPDTSGGTASPTTASAPSGGSKTPTLSGVRYRLVNLYLGPDGPATIVATPGLRADAKATAVASVEYSSVSDPFAPPGRDESTSFSLYRSGEITDDARLIQVIQPGKRGEDWIVLVTGSKEADRVAGTIQLMRGGAPQADTSGASSLQPPSAGKAQVVASGSGLGQLDGDASSMRLGVPGQGCLVSSNPEDANTLLGGTSLLPYELDPGSVQLAGYDLQDSSCSNTPVAPPVTIDAKAGQRTYVYAYGVTAAERSLLVVPA